MDQDLSRERRPLEIMLIIICLGLTCLLFSMQGYKMVILNLFFLPVALGGFFLGRYRAGVMALFCVISASLVTAFQLADMSAAASPLVLALAVAVWAAVLGLTALLIGTLSDDRLNKLKELHEAYVGVVEVLSQYLQSAHPNLKARSIRVAELSQQVAAAMKLSPREIDDVRVAALLYDMGNIEVTTRVIQRAVGTFENENTRTRQCTFQGIDLMLSLGSVLSGAVPLLLNQDEHLSEHQVTDQAVTPGDIPLGAKIIRAVRAYQALDESLPSVGHGTCPAEWLGGPTLAPAEIIARLRDDPTASYDRDVLNALERTVCRSQRVAPAPTLGTPAAQVEMPAETSTT